MRSYLLFVNILCELLYNIFCIRRHCSTSFAALRRLAASRQRLCAAPLLLVRRHRSFCFGRVLQQESYFKFVDTKDLEFLCKTSVTVFSKTFLGSVSFIAFSLKSSEMKKKVCTRLKGRLIFNERRRLFISGLFCHFPDLFSVL